MQGPLHWGLVVREDIGFDSEYTKKKRGFIAKEQGMEIAYEGTSVVRGEEDSG